MTKVVLILKERVEINDKCLLSQLNDLNFKTLNTIESIGSITGEIDSNNMEKLKLIDEIAWIEE